VIIMSVIESASGTQLEVDPSFKALRASLRPLEYRPAGQGHIGGIYRGAWSTGLVTGVAAAGPLVSVRWADADRVLVLLRAIVQATLTTAFGAAQETSVDLVRANNFKVANTGGTGVAPLGASNKLSPGMGDSQIADLRVATTAALGGGTLTADEHAVAAAILALGNTAGASVSATLFDAIAGAEHPLEFLPGQGFQIRNLFAQGATGVVRFNFSLVWAEIPRPY
jgi:hypothetical protein